MGFKPRIVLILGDAIVDVMELVHTSVLYLSYLHVTWPKEHFKRLNTSTKDIGEHYLGDDM